ncbi:UDP-N-acetylglucosamine 2-epimerase [Cylindrospermopsis raciborskii]|uniref:UDP-N-acetylglucosamine 2-epimerase n=4 Tax=Cylindrospermopsis raciborskii TaxID=77022 RepID=UPI000C9DDDBF|nr:UDP-N-acetylglucosamine 2-epimerase [Cylindrospermopsis raciborskii]PNK01634.1 UDP-N-acetylglucosamine 2-epimerase (hydrolyzing) [Cylindrospermopsis raciborskii S14]PNK02180.1 UDP-N-acetylglucosamine 2-epimerase (hydrolyzing) [Cylindrospermopsis raciborskii S10]PNK12439.1 UDP-N-acetylglucosamine 2-epimerase (hydrolyzing) [Cylindrospermopsis raciborskii S06]
MTSKRKICIVTGTRAEYGLLYWLIKEIADDPDLQLQIIATGMHLSPEFGLTYQQIEADGFSIDAKVEMLLSSDTPVGIAKSIGLGVIGFADALERLKPDILLVLGDRFEVLAAAQAAMVSRIPIAHIHGGETTEGAFDEQIRHAITKFAQWHFVAAEPYRQRVIQLGESPQRVFNLGAPGLDHLGRLDWCDRPTLEQFLGIKLLSPIFLVTYHPVTLDEQSPAIAMGELLTALDAFPQATVILTYPNADTGGRVLIEQIDQWVNSNQHRAKAFVSLGQQRYLSLMREANVIVGNSSSGITEAPALKKATVNIGDRQKGRLKAKSIIDVSEDSTSIMDAIHQALSPKFQSLLPSVQSWYGSGNVSYKIKETLKTFTPQTQKSFFDIDHV